MDPKARKNPRGAAPPEFEKKVSEARPETPVSPPESASAEAPAAADSAPHTPELPPERESVAAGAAPAARVEDAPESAAEAAPIAGFAELAGKSSAALARSQAALVQGLEELSVEFAEMARSGVESATTRASEMLSVKTFSDAVDLNFSLARDSFEAFAGGSLRLAELAVEVARKAAAPFFADFIGRAY